MVCPVRRRSPVLRMPVNTADGFYRRPNVRLLLFAKGAMEMAGYRALYRKWRPVRFEDVVGQLPIVTALQNQISMDRVGHAYLFTGTRGTGKTTCAKIFAKAVNCVNQHHGDPCGECEICKGIDDGSILDVVEIDAASNNGVDSIRDLRDETAYTPGICRYKVYIIDEVHMLSIAAFNALLKIMEEPPPHIIFILATTEIHKVPATIRSRCQRYDFGRIHPAEIAKRLEYVAQQEAIALDSNAAELIARLSDGALRDGLSILDTCASVSEQVNIELVRQMAGVTERGYLFSISNALAEEKAVEALEEIAKLRQKSVDLRRLTEELIAHYRNLLLAKIAQKGELLGGISAEEEQEYLQAANNCSETECIRAIRRLGSAIEQMSRGADQRIELELALFELCQPEQQPVIIQQPMQSSPSSNQANNLMPIGGGGFKVTQPSAVPPQTSQPVVQPEPIQKSTTASQPPKASTPPPAKEIHAPEPFEDWQKVVEILKKKAPLLHANLKDSAGFCDGRRVLIDGTEVFLEYIRKNESAKQVLKQTIEEVCGVRYGIGPYDKPKQPQETATVNTEDTLKQLQAMGVDVEIQTTNYKGESES